MAHGYGTADNENEDLSPGRNVTEMDANLELSCSANVVAGNEEYYRGREDAARLPTRDQQVNHEPATESTNISYQKSSFGVTSYELVDDKNQEGGHCCGQFFGHHVTADHLSSTGASIGNQDSSSEKENHPPYDPHERLRFIRQVYAILALQMVVTISMCALIALYLPARNFCLGPAGLPLYCGSMISTMAIVLALYFHKHSFPYNVYLLSIFTMCMSYMVGTIAAYFESQGAGEMLIESLFITATVFLGLTFFTLQSKWNFSFLSAGLGMGLWIMILWGFLGMIFGIQTGSVFALLGSLLFSTYIVFDTYMIAERLHPSDCIVAAIELYLDMVNLFLYLLRLIVSMHQ